MVEVNLSKSMEPTGASKTQSLMPSLVSEFDTLINQQQNLIFKIKTHLSKLHPLDNDLKKDVQDDKSSDTITERMDHQLTKMTRNAEGLSLINEHLKLLL